MAPVFPNTNLAIKVELLLNGVWTDITAYTYQRSSMQISGVGRADWTSTLSAAQLTLTLNNRDGRFTPKLSTGAYFPNITRNTQIRVSVNSQSVTGVVYNGFRFWGEIGEWPVRWDPSGRDVTVEVTASGIWRRLTQLVTTLGSAFRRYVHSLASPAVQAYWPMEDGTGSGQLVPFGSPAGTANAIQSFVAGEAGLSLAASSSFQGSDALPQLNAARITATVPAGGTATNNCTRFVLSVPTAGDSAAGTSNWNVAEIDSSGTIAKFEVYLNFAGTLTFQLRNVSGTILASGTTTTNVKGVPYLVSAELTPSSGNVAFALRIIQPGAAGITESLTGTVTTASVGAITTVVINRANVLMDTAIGHLYIHYASPPLMVPAANALNGYVGEKAMDRFTRICGELSIPAATIGTASTTAAMGPQVDDTIANILQSIEDTDCGLLYETRDLFALGYRSNASMANQAAAVTFDYSAKLLDTSLAPSYDDQFTKNNVTVTNWTGYTQQAILTAGAMSVLNPPSGIGNGYNLSRAVCAAADTQVPGIATFLLNVGGVDEIRFPVVGIKLVRTQAAALFASIPGLRPGDYFQITNPPAFLTTATIKQLVWGYTETLNAREWSFAFNAVPESPWETGFTPGTIQTSQIPGGSPVTSQAPGAGGLAGIIANGSITPAMLNQGITIHTFGGQAVTIAASAPSTPNVNDIWIASATGLISQWNGSSWVPQTFNAHTVIQAGTITAAEILAGTIVASNIATGTITAATGIIAGVFAGIVDATTITGATIIADGASGEILVYSGSPATGNMIMSISGAAGTDAHANNYAKGAEINGGLTLDNQGSAPPAVANASVFYSSTAGRPRYLSSAGASSVVERSEVNVGQFTCPNTATPTAVSAALVYLGGEGSQSSEYEIEIRGNGAGNTTTPQTLTFQAYLDGVAAGGAFTIGATFFSSGAPGLPNFRFTVNFILSIQTSGAGGTALIHSTGSIVNSGNFQVGATSSTSALGGISSGVAYDTTTGHSLEIRANFGATATGQTLTTFRTKLGRRM